MAVRPGGLQHSRGQGSRPPASPWPRSPPDPTFTIAASRARLTATKTSLCGQRASTTLPFKLPRACCVGRRGRLRGSASQVDSSLQGDRRAVAHAKSRLLPQCGEHTFSSQQPRSYSGALTFPGTRFRPGSLHRTTPPPKHYPSWPESPLPQPCPATLVRHRTRRLRDFLQPSGHHDLRQLYLRFAMDGTSPALHSLHMHPLGAPRHPSRDRAYPSVLSFFCLQRHPPPCPLPPPANIPFHRL